MLQTQLCETYNSRLGGEEEGSSEHEEGEEGEGKEVAKMPVVSGRVIPVYSVRGEGVVMACPVEMT